MIDYRDDARWTVYIHIVPKDISGYDHDKYYVGITSKDDPNRRWENGCGYKGQQYFWNAIQKYGWCNIIHDIVAEHLTKDEACNMEKILIKELKSCDATYGYNRTTGGESGYSRHGDGIIFDPRVQPIYQFDIDFNFVKKYDSTMEADNLFSINTTNAAFKQNLCANSYWARENNVFIDDNGVIQMKNKPVNNLRKEIFQFDENFNYIARYKSVRAAGIDNKLDDKSIARAAKLKCFCGGYCWIYKEEVDFNNESFSLIFHYLHFAMTNENEEKN